MPEKRTVLKNTLSGCFSLDARLGFDLTESLDGFLWKIPAPSIARPTTTIRPGKT